MHFKLKLNEKKSTTGKNKTIHYDENERKRREMEREKKNKKCIDMQCTMAVSTIVPHNNNRKFIT